jgi:predicted GIY-YIG superfamily endonuclease
VHFVYIVRCADGTLYTGYARDPIARVHTHNQKRGARYTRGRTPVRLVYSEACPSHGDALRRELAVKRLTRDAKEALLATGKRRRRQSTPKASSTLPGRRPNAL